MARAFVASMLHEWGCEELEDVATLLTSELVTNAVIHTHGPARLRARYDSGKVEVRVEDHFASLPVRHQAEPEDESGRGLILLSELSNGWGVEPLSDGGKAVYFVLDC